MSGIRLGVNIDHVATVRNARGETYPSPLRAALLAEKNGADSVTIHLREDRRHIYEFNLKMIIRRLKIQLNLEKSAAKEMLKQGFGQIYMFEGFGSNGQLQNGITVYGSTKRALRYFTAAAANEYKNTPILIGSLSPGIVTTDLLIRASKDNSKSWERSKKILNILADRVETVTPWLVEQTLNNKKNGAKIAWLTKRKVWGRFFGSLFSKRRIVDEWEAELNQ